MGRFTSAELRKFRDTSHCSACVHYSGCQLWLALLLMNDELGPRGLDLTMFFPWSIASARMPPTGSGERQFAKTPLLEAPPRVYA